MQRLSFISAAMITIFACQIAVAETVTLAIPLEQRLAIKEYTMKEKVRPVITQERVFVGMTVPFNIQLFPVPLAIVAAVPETRNYTYFAWDDYIVFVDPVSRKVVQLVN